MTLRRRSTGPLVGGVRLMHRSRVLVFAVVLKANKRLLDAPVGRMFVDSACPGYRYWNLKFMLPLEHKILGQITSFSR